MKTLILVRHAKSSWAQPGLSDFDRPLNERGKLNAPIMASRLHQKIKTIDSFIFSPAKRTRKTAKIFNKEFKINESKLRPEPLLYEAPFQRYNFVIEHIPNEVQTAAIFAHNPGITDFINTLSLHPIFNLPTCGIYAFQIDIDSWKEFQAGEMQFLFFDFPKNEG